MGRRGNAALPDRVTTCVRLVVGQASDVKRIAVILLAALLLACATKAKVARDRDWSPYIGNYTFGQAIEELGQPYVTGEQSDGSKFAEWIVHQSPQVSLGFGAGGGSFGSHSGVGAGTTVSPPPHGEYLHLDFGTNGLLKAWTKIRH
jgi:hypothetical protein